MSPIPTLRPLGDTLGTEALGVNLATALDAPTIDWIHQAFAAHPDDETGIVEPTVSG